MKFEKPSYLINPGICKSNIRTMADKAIRSGVAFRPHFKTHQSHVIGRWFREAGVNSITVSSVSAADFFTRDGWTDITIAFPVNLREVDTINRLASLARIGLLIEDEWVARELNTLLKFPVNAWIKIDTGLHRTGLGIAELPDIQRLATVIRDSPMLKFRGLLTHAGHTYKASSVSEIERIYRESTEIMQTVKQALEPVFRDLMISFGDTPSCSVLETFTGLDEIRPGNFVFYDLQQHAAGVCRFQQIAGIMVCPVVAVHSSRNQIVVYGGAIHFSKDFLIRNGQAIYGQLVELDETTWANPVNGAYLVSVSQEHGIIEATDDIIKTVRPGGVVGIIPVHACLTANLMHGYLLPDGRKADYFTG